MISDKNKFLGETNFYGSIVPTHERVTTAEARNRMLDTQPELKPISFRDRKKDKELHSPMRFRYEHE